MSDRTQSTALAYACAAMSLLLILWVQEYLFAIGFALVGLSWLLCLYWEDRRHRQRVNAERAARLAERRAEREYRDAWDEAA